VGGVDVLLNLPKKQHRSLLVSGNHFEDGSSNMLAGYGCGGLCGQGVEARWGDAVSECTSTRLGEAGAGFAVAGLGKMRNTEEAGRQTHSYLLAIS
jgi:hypothetical protein